MRARNRFANEFLHAYHEFLHHVPRSTRYHPRAPANGVHIPDAGWRLQDHLASLRAKHVAWRGIYWHIWGLAHVLYCHSCMRYIPAVQLHGCAYHPQPPVYGAGAAHANGGSKGGAGGGGGGAGAGFYPCCGAAAVRGSAADPSGSGCRCRDHQVGVGIGGIITCCGQL